MQQLTKITFENINFSTGNIYKFCKNFNNTNDISKIQDNMNGYLIIKYKSNNTIIYNYNKNIFYKHNIVQIHYNDKIILKQIESFDQNYFITSIKLRNYVLSKIKSCVRKSFLGIGGEYYIYWTFLNYVSDLIGISNHKSIIDDAIRNIPWSKNYLVNYNDINSLMILSKNVFYDVVLLNVFNIHNNIIKYIELLEFNILIVISCNLSNSKFKLLTNQCKLLSIKYFNNCSGLIRIMCFIKK